MSLKSIFQFGPTDRSIKGRSVGAIINDRLCLPSLKALYELGSNDYISNSVLGKFLSREVNFNEDDKVVHGNKIEWVYRMEWALNKLKNSGLIKKDPENYLSWKISESGIAFLVENGIDQSTEIEEDQITRIRQSIIKMEKKSKSTQLEELKAKANNLIASLLEKVRDLSGSEVFNDWTYEKIANESFGSPGGSWDPKEFEGFQFKNDTLDKTFILRFISTNREYIVVESLSDRVQIVNYRLDEDKKRLSSKTGVTSLFEDGLMTVSHRVPKEVAKKALIEVGFNENMLITSFEEIPGNEEQIISDILNWANYRLNAKSLIRSRREEAPMIETDSKDEIVSFIQKSNSSNIILFGPPGTGKTYNTIDLSVQIAAKERYQPNNHEANKKVYDELVEEGLIFFTTFHQSMTYEDFVEGIKPKMNGEDENEVSYEIEKGIFKSICRKAENKSGLNSNDNNFDETWDKLVELVKNKILNGELMKIGSWEYGLSSKDSLKYSSINTPSKYNFTITKQNVYDAYRNIKARPSGAFQKDMEDVVVFMKNQLDLNNHEENEISYDNTTQNFVLIIDEINRGNVSQIFGELITLIEEDKRLGNPEAIQVQLPYSKDWFGVPPNVHIIGTMNTADRSVEALDTALRRRFSFTEMLPNPSIITKYGKAEDGIIEGYLLEDILTTINKRVEKLLDRDHTIGHSYFLKLENLDDLKNCFQNNIIPLLQEYFFGDYGKIGLVIGKGFFLEENEELEDDIFADFEHEARSAFNNRKVYNLKDVSSLDAEAFKFALNLLLGKNG